MPDKDDIVMISTPIADVTTSKPKANLVTRHLDKLVAARQAKCPHNYQDRIVVDRTGKVFCGKCGDGNY